MRNIAAARRGCVAHRPLIVLAVLLVVSLGPRPAEARNCRDETPLPGNIKLIAPGPDIAPEAARFAGAWTGAWKQQATDTICATLVVEELLPSGHARVIYSHGASEPLGVPVPAYWRATGRVVDGVLRFSLPIPDPPAFAYTFSGAALSGTFRGDGNHAVTRAGDVSGIGCGAKVAGVAPPPNAASPRDRLTAAELLSGVPAGDGPVHNDYFMPLGAAAPARHALRGKLSFAAATTSVAYRGCRGIPLPTPAFSVEFFTQGDRLVPVERGIVRPPGTVIVAPGRVWSEPGDQGMSRASFPFVSVDELNNGTHNGLATFLFDDLSFWSIPYRTSAGCFFQIPFMLGYGGNLAVLLPNGVSAFRFADAGSSDAESMILAGEAIRPPCAQAAPAAAAPPRPPMTTRELRAEVVGRTFAAGAATIAVDRSGVVTVESKADVDVGRWHITEDGQYCRTWNVGDRRRLRCYRVYRDGEAFELHAVDRWTVTKLQRQP